HVPNVFFDVEDLVQLTMQVQPAGAGTTVPEPGTRDVARNSVIAVKAIPSPGFRLSTWSANVTDLIQPSTSIFMQMSEWVTAFFEACACAADVTPSVGISLGGVTMNPITRRYVQTVTLTNNSAATITGPISLVLDNLTAGGALWKAQRATKFLAADGR